MTSGAGQDGYFALRRELQQPVTADPFAVLTPEARSRVKAIGKELAVQVGRWAAGFPVVSSQRLAAAWMAAAVTYPDGDRTLLLEIAKFYLELWAMDDVVDGVVADQGEARTQALLVLLMRITESGGAPCRECTDLLASLGPVDDGAPWAQAAELHGEFCRTLQGMPGAVAYYGPFAARFVAMLHSWQVEEQWKRDVAERSAYPTYDAYLANGRESVIHAAILLAFLVMRPPQALPGWPAIGSAVERVLIPASTSIRLANDLRSYARDLAEGKPTALGLLMQERQLDEAGAERELLAGIEHERETMRQAVAELPEALADWGAAVWRITSFGIDFYLVQEFHHYRAGE